MRSDVNIFLHSPSEVLFVRALRLIRSLELPILLSMIALILNNSSLHSQNHFGTPSFNSNIQTIINSTSLDSLQKFIKQLSGVIPVNPTGQYVTLTHRKSGSTQFRTAADFISMQFNNYGLNPVIDNNVSPWNKVNVIGTLQGEVDEYVIMSGHFDSKSETCPGADDNASGTTAVLEAARILKNYNFHYTIKFIAFGGEEQGLLGSKDYSAKHAGDSIRAVVNCDMIMWDGDADLVMQIHAIANDAQQYSNDLASYIIKIDSIYYVPAVCMKVLPGITGSDHSPFWNQKKSAVLFIEEYGIDFNPYYHTANDSWTNLSESKHQNFFHASSKQAASSVSHLAGFISQKPVELVSFSAHADGNNILLFWKTASEKNNAGFEVERRMNAMEKGRNGEWKIIGFVDGHGTSTIRHDYSFIDLLESELPTLNSKFISYRLKQIDTDGSKQYSPIVTVDLQSTPQTMVLEQNYPNPFSVISDQSTVINYAIEKNARVTLKLFNVLGQEVAILIDDELDAGRYSVTVPQSLFDRHAASGIYYYTLSANGKTLTRKMAVVR